MISCVILNDHGRDSQKTRASLGWCDEIIELKEPINNDFAKARNRALNLAKGDWVFYIDSDETVSPDLAREIQSVSGHNGYFLKRDDYFWGKKLRYGETSVVKLLRLGKRDAGVWVRPVHEYWDIKDVGELKNHLIHYPHQSIGEFIKSLNYYSDIDAKEFKFSYLDLFKPVAKFISNYVIKLGFLDGYPGLAVAFMLSFQSLAVRIKSYELNKNIT